MPRLLLLAALAPLRAAGQQVAVVTVREPEELRGDYMGFFATFSGPLPEAAAAPLAAWVPQDPLGCAAYLAPQTTPGGPPGIALTRRGECTFVRKAELARQAGAGVVLVASNASDPRLQYLPLDMGGVNSTEGPVKVGVATIGISRDLGDKLMSWSSEHGLVGDGRAGGRPVVMSFKVYEPPLFNWAEVMIVFLGTGLVAAGAFFSTSDLSTRGSLQQAIAAPQDEVMEVDYILAFGFFIFGSCFLVILFFFMKYMIYFIIFAFCMGGFNTLTQIGSILLQWLSPQMKQGVATVPQLGVVSRGEMIAAVPAVLTVVGWLFLRNTEYGWPFQDIIGAGFLCWLQRTLRLPNIKIASLFLSIMFCFDIFWVFISPLIFRSSVMVTVATGGDTGESVPMLLRLPSIGDPFGHDRLLGFGDIALPGLLVSFLLRHDVQSRRPGLLGEGYFGPVLLGYFLGLVTTIVALSIMQKGQPALLYLVPGTLGTTVVRGALRGELGHLWDGRPCGAGAGGRGGRGGPQAAAYGDCQYLTSDQEQGGGPSTCITGNDGL